MSAQTGFVLSALDVLIIVGSIALVLVVGLLASRRQAKTARNYFVAADKLPWWIIGSAFVSTSVSSEQIVGVIGAAYRQGLSVANWEWWTMPTYALLIVFFIPIYLSNRITTVPELLSRRFGPVASDIYSVVMLLAYVVVFLVPVLYSGSLVFSELTGWDFSAVLWGTVVLVGLYSIKGGLISVMWTDAVQCVLLIGGGLVLFFVALGRVPGGWDAMVQARPDRFHLYRPPGDPDAPFLGLLCGSVGVFLFYQATNQVMIQRILAARTTWDGGMGIVFAGFINLVRPLVTCLLGLVVYHWIFTMKQAPPLENPDTAFPFALATFASSSGLRGVVLAGFIAAVMSAVSALANSTATIFALNVYQRWIRPDADDRALVRAGRVASVTALALAALLCPLVARMGGIFRYFQTGVTYVAAPFISVFLLGIFWKRANYAGALFGIIGGLLLQIGAAIGAAALGVHLHWLYLAFFVQVVTMVGVVVVSLLTPPPPPERWQPFVWRPDMLRRYAHAHARWYHSLRLWFGVYAACWMSIYIVLW